MGPRGDRPREAHPGPLLVPVLVITEVAYLIGTRPGAEPEVRFLGDLAAGNLVTETVDAGDRPVTVVRPRHVSSFTLVP